MSILTIREIERHQLQLEHARQRVRESTQRQQERVEENRRVIE
jgi:hypothetical protein